MRTVRIFISSPSDANRERDRLSRVARRLNRIYAEVVELQIIRWEDDFYSAHETFQTQIPEAKTCDIVIGILKHRLGSPLPSTFPHMPESDPFRGEAYPSGTAYEILSSIANRVLDGSEKPDIYVFRDEEPPVVSLGSGDMERIGREWTRLEDFARRFFFTAEGDFRFAFQTFRSANQFEAQIENLLRKWIETNVYAEHRSTWPVDTKGSPFRALDVFDFAHRDVFFGRDRDTARIVELLADIGTEALAPDSTKQPFLLLTGPSGAGKSSLLRAGVVPALIGSDVADTEQWRAAIMTPLATGQGPFRALAAALLGAEPGKMPSEEAGAAKDDELLALPELRAGAFSNVDSLAKLLAHADTSAALVVIDALQRVEKDLSAKEKFDKPPKVRLLLVIDQLDEIFSSEVSESDRAAFAALLTEFANTDNIWIAASLRAGLYESYLSEPGFFALRNAGAIYDLGPPGTTELADIVRKPAQAADIVYEKDPVSGSVLDELLLADFDRPDMLPLLQFTLEALFQRRETRDGVMTLTHAAYRNMNGIAGAVQTAAAAAMAKVGEAERQKLPKLLRRLVTTGQAGETENAPLVLNDVPASDLEGDPEMLRLAEALTESRILVASGFSTQSRSYRLAHQRLLTLWDDAATAIQENTTFYRVSDELERARRRWQRLGRRSSQLIRDPILLTEATRLSRSYPDEIRHESLEFIRRSRLRARRGTIILGVAAFVFAVLFAGTIWFYQKAKDAEALALEQKKKAEDSFDLAQNTLQGVVSDIAGGLKNVQGMSIENRRAILMRVSRSVDMLRYTAGDNPALNSTRAMMLKAFGDAYWSGGDTLKALQSYQEATSLYIGMLKTAKGADLNEANRQIANGLDNIGDILVSQGKRDDALQIFNKSIRIRQKLLAANPKDSMLKRDAMTTTERLVQLRQAMGDVKGAIETLGQSIAQSRAQLKLYPGDTGTKRDLSVDLEGSADLELQRGNRTKAEALSKEALDIRKQLYDLNPNDTFAASDYMISLRRKADFARDSGDQATAKETYGQALTMAQKLSASDPGNVVWQRDVAIVLNNLGDIFEAEDNAGKARENYEQALSMARKMAAINPQNVVFQSDVAYGLNKIADLLQKQAKYKEADPFYEQSLVIARQQAAADSGRLDLQRNISFTLTRIGDTKYLANDRDGAMSAYKEALTIARKLTGTDATNIIWQNDLQLIISRIADLQFDKRQMQDALAGLRESAEILNRLRLVDPNRVDWQNTMAAMLDRMGDASVSLADTASAMDSYQRGLSLVVDLLKNTPGASRLQRRQAYFLGKIGTLQYRQGDRTAAAANFKQALDIARTIVRKDPNAGDAQTDVALGLLNLEQVQTGAERLASLKEAATIADKLAAANQLAAAQKTLPDRIRAELAKALP